MITVDVMTLDEAMPDARVDVLKVDVEGVTEVDLYAAVDAGGRSATDH